MSRSFPVIRNTLVAGLLALLTLSGCGPDTDSTAAGGAGKLQVLPSDRTLGNPKAPIQFIEYAAPSCPHCAHFNETVFPMLKRDYIDKGKVFYIFRVFPIGAQDIPAEALARCMPKDSYFAFMDLLFRQQQVWDPEYGITNVQAGLVEVANVAGVPQDRAIACMQNKAEADRINKSAQEAMDKFKLSSTPSFVVNGELRQIAADQDSMRKFLDALLSKK
jgi:protein-disulfide isomerase